MAKKKTEVKEVEEVKDMKEFKARSFAVNFGDFIGLFDVDKDGLLTGNVTIEGKRYNFNTELKEV